MSTTDDAIGRGQAASLPHRLFGFLRKYWVAFQERRKCRGPGVALSDLSDAELADIGTTRGEIDRVASNLCIDPPSVLCTEWMRFMQALDGRTTYFQEHQDPDRDVR